MYYVKLKKLNVLLFIQIEINLKTTMYCNVNRYILTEILKQQFQ